MKIKFNVNQKQALRLGIDAPSSTSMLEINPAELSERDRAILAAILVDGHDATQLGLQTEVDGWVGQHYSPQDKYTPLVTRCSNGSPTGVLTANGPTLQHLVEAIGWLAAEVEEKRALWKKKEADELADIRRRLREDEERLEMMEKLEDLSGLAHVRTGGQFVDEGNGWFRREWIITKDYPTLPADVKSYSPKNLYIRPDLEPRTKALTARVQAWCDERNWFAIDLQKRLNAERSDASQKLKDAKAAKAAETKEAIRAAIFRLGTPAEKTGFERGLLNAPGARAAQLLKEEVFSGCDWPLHTRPTKEDIKLDDGLNLPPDANVERDIICAENNGRGGFDRDELALFLEVETKVKAKFPKASVQPMWDGITFDHPDVGWEYAAFARVTVEHGGFTHQLDLSLDGWDAQIKRDSDAGKFDKIAEEVKQPA
jgi:hypothetical protein